MNGENVTVLCNINKKEEPQRLAVVLWRSFA
jgi:hypothetical protein